MIESSAMRFLCCTLAAGGLSACGGGEVGGTVSGLGTGLSLTLNNNNVDPLTITRNGSFTFEKSLSAEAAYAVTVQTQPVGQLCEVANGTGSLNADGDTIDNVTVTCTHSASIAGSLSGLVVGTAVILGNGSMQLPLASNGPFAFPGTVAAGTAYNVVVDIQPLGTTCTVTNGAGNFVENVGTNIRVTCE
jgi:hypothetical protein